MHQHYDGEVLRLSETGTIIQWDAETRTEYDSGETLEEFGDHNLTPIELARVA